MLFQLCNVSDGVFYLSFLPFQVKFLDDERGWDWTDANSTETGTAKYKSTSSQNMEKESASSYRMDNSIVKARNHTIME